MAFSANTIARVVDQINRSFFLPAIQRPFVWEPEQIIALFDSLLKGYPISTFLFWELSPENRHNWEIYKFVENFRYGTVHNEITEPDGRDILLVLDGQQRLTSLLLGLRGSYTIKLSKKRWDNPLAWVKKRLYINLLKDPEKDDSLDDNREFGVTYGLKFFESAPIQGTNQLWFKVGRILDFSDENAFDHFKDELVEGLPGDATRDQERTAKRNLDRLYRTIWKDDVISFYTEKNQSYDRVLDIFIRANDGGTKLSKSDLLLSMITSKWNGLNARDEIFNFVERLNGELDRKNNFDKDFIMRSCLVLSDLDVGYNIDNFTNKSLSIIQAKWPVIKSSIESTVKLINRIGIDRDTLTSTNALTPIAYYFSKLNGVALDGSTPFDSINREKIRRWIHGALLNTTFGGTSDQTIALARLTVRESSEKNKDFPYTELNDALQKRGGRMGRAVTFDDDNVTALLETRYNQRTCFLALSVLYDDQNWGSSSYHIDHIVPRSLVTRDALQGKGLSSTKIDETLRAVDSIGNLQLLLGRENSEKSNMNFSDWIQTRDPEFLDRHLIPDNSDLWEPDTLLKFIAAREKLIKKRMASFGYFPQSSPPSNDAFTSPLPLGE